MEVDWDLHAVVRGCCSNASSTAAATTNSTTSSYSTSELNFQPQPSCAKKATSLEPFEAGRFTFVEELHELYKPFLHHKPVSSPPVLQSVKDSLKNTTDDLKRKLCAVKASSSHSQAPRSKKRKSIMKKVCRIPVEKLSSDVWAWRKYGQKPIKGSPHPRSYYKCSSSKGCLARRQVERDRSDPENFIVTYTAEHNHPAPTHRNSLAGSTRHKPSTPQADISVDSSSTATPSTASTEEEAALLVAPQSESREDKEDNSVVDDDEEDGDADGGDGEGESGSSEMALSDDFFVGLEGLMGPGEDGALFSDPFQSCFGFSWMSGGTVTAGDG